MPEQFQLNRCIIGDVRAVLPTLPANSVHCVVTSPPYWGHRDYGVAGQIGLEESPFDYLDSLVDIFREVRRVLRDDGSLWLNMGDTYATGAGSCRNPGGNMGKQEGIGQRGGIPRVQPNRLPIEGFKKKDLIGLPWRLAFALQADGWWLRSDIIWAKQNPMPESVTDRPTKAHEYIFALSKQEPDEGLHEYLFLLGKSERYFYDQEAIKEPLVQPRSSTADDAARAFSRKREQDPRRDQAEARLHAPTPDTRNARTVWSIPSEPYSGAHFACFPRELAQRCMLAGCPLGGIVLDPFFGSGTVGQVAQRNGRQWLGIELNPEYEPLWPERTAQQGLAFGEPPTAKRKRGGR
jgi:DNA modification methylase